MSLQSNRFSWGVILLTCISGLLVTGLSDTAPDALAESPKSESTPLEPAQVEVAKPSKPVFKTKGPVIADESAIGDLQRVRQELNEKQKELEKRESELVAKEKALQEEISKIDELRSEISKNEGSSSQQASEKVAKLVETFETMSPKSAAQLILNLDVSLATQALSQLSSLKLGKILSAMDPVRSARLTESLAGVARAKKLTASHGAAEAAEPKGGNNTNGNINKSNDQPVTSRQPEPALGREPASSSKQ
jgi:flagellar motility protein MotE (MotC chaperone)